MKLENRPVTGAEVREVIAMVTNLWKYATGADAAGYATIGGWLIAVTSAVNDKTQYIHLFN